MIVSMTWDEIKNTPLTNEEKEQLSALKDRIPEPDEDCPELSPRRIEALRRAADERRDRLDKQEIPIYVKPETIEKIKKFGNSYTTILGRIVDDAVNNPEILKSYSESTENHTLRI